MSDHFDLLELDNPSSIRGAKPTPIKATVTPISAPVTVTADEMVEAEANPTTLLGDLTSIAQTGATNAANVAANNLGSMAGGQMRGVGFSTRDGYITALRNGVPSHTWTSYIQTLRTSYGMTSADIAALNLPGPMVENALPVGAGVTHTPAGPSFFDQPKAERRALVTAPPAAQAEAKVDLRVTDKQLVAGAVAEGHHAIVAWEGTTGTLRGELVAALTAIGREAWAPKAPNARAQAGSAIATLSAKGLHVRSQRKAKGSDLDVNEHVWTVGTVSHTGSIGTAYGEVTVRFKLSGGTLSYDGSDAIGAPVVVDFNARIASEVFKSSDVTSWLSRSLRNHLDAVSFGALGYIVPAKHAASATQLCKALQDAGFGSGWVTGLPVATTDQLRDGIVRSLVDEVFELVNKLAAERASAKDARAMAIAEQLASGRVDAALDIRLSGDIGEKRAQTYLKDLRGIGARVVAYGEILGESRVDQAQRHIRDAIASLETLLGGDYTGISARFAEVWEEIEIDRKRNGGVL